MTYLAAASACICGLGLIQHGVGAFLLRHQARHPVPEAKTPPVSILKPLHGAEPLLDAALESFFIIDYPVYQLVFGVSRRGDPALEIVERLRCRYPQVDAVVVVDSTPHGVNRKISNLINMLPAARHEILVISDADMHVPQNFLRAVTVALTRRGAGMATTFYTGLPASCSLAGRLGAAHINHGFLPAAALARAMGRQDCLGATMALTRASLAAIGGLEALSGHLADDNVLGQLVRRLGRNVEIAPVIPATTVPETSLASLWRHELRWARTIRALVPAAYMGIILQFPLFWALLAFAVSGFALWSWIVLGVAATVRVIVARRLEQWLELATGAGSITGIWFLPLRDALSAAIFAASFWSDTVEWRGHVLRAGSSRAAKPTTSLGNARAKTAHD